MEDKRPKALKFLIIVLIFSLTGISSVYISGIIMQALNAEKWSLAYILGIIFIITPVYNILLLLYAALFGKFHYFLGKQKTLLRRLFRFFINIGQDR